MKDLSLGLELVADGALAAGVAPGEEESAHGLNAHSRREEVLVAPFPLQNLTFVDSVRLIKVFDGPYYTVNFTCKITPNFTVRMASHRIDRSVYHVNFLIN